MFAPFGDPYICWDFCVAAVIATHQPSQALARCWPDLRREGSRWLVSGPRRGVRGPRWAGPASYGRLVRASILIADDDSVSRKLLIRLLEQDGHDVRAAE